MANRDIWFQERRGAPFDAQNSFRDLEARIADAFRRVRLEADGLSSSITLNETNITSILEGATLGDDLPEDVSLVAAAVGDSTEASPLNHVHFLAPQDIVDATNDLMDHGLLLGLGDDDHPIYFHHDGSQVATGDFDLSGFAIENIDYIENTSATTPTAGFVRVGSNVVVIGGADASGANAALMRWTAGDDLVLGDDVEVDIVRLDASDVVAMRPGGAATNSYVFSSTECDFNGRNIEELGRLDFDGTISSAGDVNAPSGFSIYGRDNANSVDLALLVHDAATDDLILGTVATEQGGTTLRGNSLIAIEVVTAGVEDYRFTGSQLLMRANNLNMEIGDIINVGDSIQFDITSTPVIDQETQTSGDAAPMYVIAQDTSDAAGGIGGSLYLVAADGLHPGGEFPDPHGSVFVECGLGNTVAEFGFADIEFEVPVNMNANDIDTEGGDLLMGGGVFDLEGGSINSDGSGVDFTEAINLSGNRIFGVDYLAWDGFTVAAAPGGVEGDIGFCSNGNAGSPCMAIYWNGAWRVWLTHAAGDALTAIAAA